MIFQSFNGHFVFHGQKVRMYHVHDFVEETLFDTDMDNGVSVLEAEEE